MRRSGMLRLPFLTLAVTAACVLSSSPRLSATGFFINQQSVRALGRVNAGTVVAADELATIFFNPAGLPIVVDDDTLGRRIRISIGGHLIIPRGRQRARLAAAATPRTLSGMVPIGGCDVENTTSSPPIPQVYAISRPVFALFEDTKTRAAGRNTTEPQT